MFYISDRHQELYTESGWHEIRYVRATWERKQSGAMGGGGKGVIAVRVQHVATAIT